MTNRKLVLGVFKVCLLLMPFMLLQSCSKGGSKLPSSSKKSGKSSSTASKSKGSKGGGSKSGGKTFGRRGGKETPGIINGEITAGARKGWQQSTPTGMVLIPSGSFTMGQSDEDIMASKVNMNKRVTISPFYMDDTEITNNEYRQFVDAMLKDSVSVLGEEFIMTQLYPDTTVWKKDFTYHYGDPWAEYYYSSPAFDTYPVVGVSWDAARYFCDWRSKLYNDYRSQNSQFKSPAFMLPSEAQWEWAARGGRDGAKYPWGNPYVANAKGCYLANFKPNRGKYDADGYSYTAPSNSFAPNDYGLYNMAGNVSEWCLDAYADAAVPLTWDLDPRYEDENEPRKIIKGGSWKDVAYFLETGTRNYELKNNKKAFIGFRSVMNRLGSVPGRE